MSQKFIQTPAIALYTGMSGAATSAVITPYPTDIQTGRKLTMADWGTIGFFTVDPKISGYEEINSFTGLTDNGDGTGTLTGLVRNLIGEDPYTTPGTGKQHGSSAVVVFSNNPQLYASLASLANPNTFLALNIFSGYAPQTTVDPVSPNDLTRLSYVQALVLGTLTTINVVVPGTAGVTLVAGNSVYFDDPTNLWKKTDATNAATVDDVLLGIVQAGNTTGNPISVLLQGVDANQSGLTDGQTQYASNTPGAISSSAGTVSVVLGISKGTTQLYFAPRFNQQITQNQLAALAGTSGTPPSGSNKFIDNADSTGTGPVQRLSQLPTVKFGGTGADGALTVASGATNIDLGGSQYVVKNYTSISITGTGQITFTNPHANGTIIVLKSQGNVTLTSSTIPNIDASGMGASGGAGGTGGSTSNGGGAGNTGTNIFDDSVHAGSGGVASASGGAGGPAGAIFAAGTLQFYTRNAYQLARAIKGIAAGSGGGGGAGNNSTTARTGGAGGYGGAGLIIQCGGALNFTSALGISVAGKNGSNGVTDTVGANNGRGGSGGGGGGAGGFCLVLYNSLTAASGTINSAGGTGGTGGDATTDGTGGGGGQQTGGAGGGGAGSYGGAGGVGGAQQASQGNGNVGNAAAGGRAGGGGGSGASRTYNSAGTSTGAAGGAGGASENVLVALNNEFA